MGSIKQVKVWKKNGEWDMVYVKYNRGKDRAIKGSETLPMTVARFIFNATRCLTTYTGAHTSVETYEF